MPLDKKEIGFSLIEKIDRQGALKIMQSDIFKNQTAADQRAFGKVVSIAKNNGGHLKVNYCINKEKFGRFKAEVEGSSSETGYAWCMTYIRREYRAILCKPYYQDIDMVNAHPTILRQILHSYGIPCPVLDIYVENRDQLLREVMNCKNELPISREQAKELYIALIFGGNLSNLVKEKNIEFSALPDSIINFHEELQRNGDLLFKLSDMQGLNNYWEEHIKPKKDYNMRGSKLSLLLQTKERELIEALIPAIQRDGFAVGSIIYDGVHVEKNGTEITEELLGKWSIAMKAETGIDMKLSIKDFEIDPLYLGEVEETIVQPNGKYNSSFMREVVEYDIFKKRFEEIACKVRKQNLYIIREPDGTESYKNVKSLFETYRNLRCIVYDKKHEAVEDSFIKRWLDDPKMRCYDSLKFLPPPLVCPESEYNTWKGFAIEKYQTDKEINVNSPGVLEILKYIKMLFRRNEAYYDYILDWISFLIQFPAKKPQGAVALILYSQANGTGKSTFTRMMEKMLGNDLYFETSKPERDLFGEFSSLRENRLLISVAEAATKESYVHHNQIKDMITSDRLVVNQKGLEKYDTTDFSRFIFTTNNTIKIDNRRYFIVEVSDEYSASKESDPERKQQLLDYWTTLNDNYLDNQHTMLELFTFFKTREIKVKKLENFPTTNLYEELQTANVPIILQFLKHLTESTTPICNQAPNTEEEQARALLDEALCNDKVAVYRTDMFALLPKFLERTGNKDMKFTSRSFDQKLNEYIKPDRNEYLRAISEVRFKGDSKFKVVFSRKELSDEISARYRI